VSNDVCETPVEPPGSNSTSSNTPRVSGGDMLRMITRSSLCDSLKVEGGTSLLTGTSLVRYEGGGIRRADASSLKVLFLEVKNLRTGLRG
jgi:hypothetical protein